MSNSTENNGQKQDWSSVIAASQDAQDPPPRRFREKLTCRLSTEEQMKIGLQYADTVERKTDFENESKRLAAERKSALAKIIEDEKRLRDAFRTGRIDRDVEVVEQTSIRLGKKWKMRLDTGENYDEKPLSAEERQTHLPTTQLPLVDQRQASAGNDDGEEEEDDDTAGGSYGGDPPEDEPDDGTSIDDPDQLLKDAAEEDEEDGD